MIEAFDGLFQVYGSPKCFFDPRRYSASGYHGCATDGCGGGGCWDPAAFRVSACTGTMAPELALSCALDCPIPEKACDGGYYNCPGFYKVYMNCEGHFGGGGMGPHCYLQFWCTKSNTDETYHDC